MKTPPHIVCAIASVVAVIIGICAICAIAPPPQPAQCCTPRVQTVNADGTTWLCLIEEDTNVVERHRSCQMVNTTNRSVTESHETEANQ